MSRVPFKEQVLRVREDAIVEAVNRLLVSKGYDLMTVDEVAAEAGLSKASLYKHFMSKEELAAAAMVRVLDRTLAVVEGRRQQSPEASAVDQLRAVVRWTLQVQLAGEMPTLPAQNSRLVSTLKAHRGYMDRLLQLSDLLGEWITASQAQGDINPELPPELVLFTLFARACDPVLPLLKAGGQHSDEAIIEWVTSTTFSGLAGPVQGKARRVRAAA
ncbi:TetR/AcrR family transcriptional regulator [Roseateles amylovorans]|uniref:TetR/AcrR family transcriptional regulator n=1 Tax=Roseateles amylovorans TaxID=2978473 RepID=A0ABY6AX64_9BURK|nr:TetR/AcrR family transcriptional regulator [Roseateles amylovorans]UXH76354.1 TetR/AcrR family transcriptional regulator [Roseateles amylovorans]